MDIGGPLRGTWLTVLVISIAFAAAGVAAAEPWSAPVGTSLPADAPEIVTTTTTGAPGTTGATPLTGGAPAIAASGHTEGTDVTPSSDETTTHEIALWERQENHGLYVSRQAKDTAGTGDGCDVSDVARSDVGKPDTSKSDPPSATGACDDSPSASDTSKGNSDKDDDTSNSGSGNAAKGDDTSKGNSGKGDGGDE